MSYAIYGESLAYVHLVAAETPEKAVHLFLKDVVDVGVKLSHVHNVYAVYKNQEDLGVQRFVEELITKDDKQNE